MFAFVYSSASRQSRFFLTGFTGSIGFYVNVFDFTPHMRLKASTMFHGYLHPEDGDNTNSDTCICTLYESLNHAKCTWLERIKKKKLKVPSQLNVLGDLKLKRLTGQIYTDW